MAGVGRLSGRRDFLTRSGIAAMLAMVGSAAKATLTPSGPVRPSDGAVIENLTILGKPGQPALDARGRRHLVIRNCRIEHPISCHGVRLVDCPGVLIENCDFLVPDAPPAGPLWRETNAVELSNCSDAVVRRVRSWNSSAAIYVIDSGGVRLEEIEGYDQRGPYPRGMLVQFNRCRDSLLQDFSARNDIKVAATGDNVSVYASARCIIRRGLLDGNTDPVGAGVMFEHSEDGLCEDVDIVRFSNCAFGAYPAKRILFRRCRARESYRPTRFGEPSSNSIIFAASKEAQDIRAVQAVYFAHVNPTNLVYDRSRFIEWELVERDFQPRQPVRLGNLPR
jgi:hypothetical protein